MLAKPNPSARFYKNDKMYVFCGPILPYDERHEQTTGKSSFGILENSESKINVKLYHFGKRVENSPELDLEENFTF